MLYRYWRPFGPGFQQLLALADDYFNGASCGLAADQDLARRRPCACRFPPQQRASCGSAQDCGFDHGVSERSHAGSLNPYRTAPSPKRGPSGAAASRAARVAGATIAPGAASVLYCRPRTTNGEGSSCGPTTGSSCGDRGVCGAGGNFARLGGSADRPSAGLREHQGGASAGLLRGGRLVLGGAPHARPQRASG